MYTTTPTSASTTTSSTSTSTLTNPASTSSSTSGGSHWNPGSGVGKAAGMWVGTGFAIIAIITAVFFVRRHRKKKRARAATVEDPMTGVYSSVQETASEPLQRHNMENTVAPQGLENTQKRANVQDHQLKGGLGSQHVRIHQISSDGLDGRMFPKMIALVLYG
ncbi:uncharacterized protein CDV56_100981 [Aspergillus thermomutatus]|uniref:Mid2 domain-containing protein n=1 Tax=Aspergillus thermomutatus TaxID=41047 RepID=A0A397FWX0_ASPTH|nr:uncharacterized protein CDV56_100981 [Aspergillus thermomutatus]RHZ43271.1 hypothetical protein CDV56_100981 [Aspergillus thermomutatus]